MKEIYGEINFWKIYISGEENGSIWVNFSDMK